MSMSETQERIMGLWKDSPTCYFSGQKIIDLFDGHSDDIELEVGGLIDRRKILVYNKELKFASWRIYQNLTSVEE